MITFYKIAIPSYRRPATIREKTLQYLMDCGANMRNVYIFVANPAEYKDYVHLSEYGVNVVIGAETLRGQRNFIQHYFAEGERVLNIDDDVEGVYVKLSDKKYEKELQLTNLVRTGFEACAAFGTKLWGISAVLNPLFMQHKITSDLKYIVGCFWGCIIDHSPELSVSLEDKEDFERTILYYKKFGSVIRLNHLAPKTSYYSESGGMQVTRTEQRVTESAMYLAKKYPSLCRLNLTKKSGHAEIRLHHKLKTA